MISINFYSKFKLINNCNKFASINVKAKDILCVLITIIPYNKLGNIILIILRLINC